MGNIIASCADATATLVDLTQDDIGFDNNKQSIVNYRYMPWSFPSNNPSSPKYIAKAVIYKTTAHDSSDDYYTDQNGDGLVSKWSAGQATQVQLSSSTTYQYKCYRIELDENLIYSTPILAEKIIKEKYRESVIADYTDNILYWQNLTGISEKQRSEKISELQNNLNTFKNNEYYKWKIDKTFYQNRPLVIAYEVSTRKLVGLVLNVEYVLEGYNTYSSHTETQVTTWSSESELTITIPTELRTDPQTEVKVVDDEDRDLIARKDDIFSNCQVIYAVGANQTDDQVSKGLLNCFINIQINNDNYWQIMNIKNYKWQSPELLDKQVFTSENKKTSFEYYQVNTSSSGYTGRYVIQLYPRKILCICEDRENNHAAFPELWINTTYEFVRKQLQNVYGGDVCGNKVEGFKATILEDEEDSRVRKAFKWIRKSTYPIFVFLCHGGQYDNNEVTWVTDNICLYDWNFAEIFDKFKQAVVVSQACYSYGTVMSGRGQSGAICFAETYENCPYNNYYILNECATSPGWAYVGVSLLEDMCVNRVGLTYKKLASEINSQILSWRNSIYGSINTLLRGIYPLMITTTENGKYLFKSNIITRFKSEYTDLLRDISNNGSEFFLDMRNYRTSHGESYGLLDWLLLFISPADAYYKVDIFEGTSNESWWKDAKPTEAFKSYKNTITTNICKLWLLMLRNDSTAQYTITHKPAGRTAFASLYNELKNSNSWFDDTASSTSIALQKQIFSAIFTYMDKIKSFINDQMIDSSLSKYNTARKWCYYRHLITDYPHIGYASTPDFMNKKVFEF